MKEDKKIQSNIELAKNCLKADNKKTQKIY